MARPREDTESGITLIRSNQVDHSLQRTADRINEMKFAEGLFKKAMSHVATNPAVLKEWPQLRPEQGKGYSKLATSVCAKSVPTSSRGQSCVLATS